MTSPRLHVVAAVLQDGQRFFVQQRPAGKDMAGYWEFPGGKVESGESPWSALVRELAEELAITALEGDPLVQLLHSCPDRDIHLDVWRVTAWSGYPTPQEQQEIAWNTLTELVDVPLLPADIPVLEALAQESGR